MYEATADEAKKLIAQYGYTQDEINALNIESDKIRHGIPVDFMAAMVVMDYQSELQAIRKSLKKWWQFWKYL